MPWRPLTEVIAAATATDRDVASLANLVYTSVARYVHYDFACFAVTDPASGLVTWASKTRSLGVGDEEFAAVESGPPDLNSYADAERDPPVGALSIDTGGHPERCRAAPRADAASLRVHRRIARPFPEPGRDVGRDGPVPGARRAGVQCGGCRSARRDRRNGRHRTR
jgi:hypothetical protein